MTPPGRRSTARFQLPSWRSLRTRLLLVLVFTVVVVVAWTTLVNFLTVSTEPQDAVDGYLDQLEGGSARQVLAPLDAVRKDPTVQILPNQVYRNAADRPAGHDIAATTVHGDTADVAVDVRMGDGQAYRLTYTVHKRRAWGVLNDSWQLHERDNATVRVRLPAALDSLTVNGQAVRPDAGALRATDHPPARNWQFEGLPGAYRIGFPEDSYYRAGGDATDSIDIRDPRPITIDLELRPSPRMWQSVDDEITEAIERCESNLLVDAGRCPLPGDVATATAASATASPGIPSSPTAAPSDAASATTLPTGGPPVIADAEWELESRPPLVLQPDAQDPLSFHAQRYRPAVATVTYREGGRTVSRRVRFGVEASVRSTGDRADVEVRLRPALTRQEKDYPGS